MQKFPDGNYGMSDYNVCIVSIKAEAHKGHTVTISRMENDNTICNINKGPTFSLLHKAPPAYDLYIS